MGKYSYSDLRTPDVCIVGAGFSGLTAAIRLKMELKMFSFKIFDENNDVGGTWLVNTYPGCACDVQSHVYSWSFEPNPNWSKNYSPQEEIWEYMRKTARKYEIYGHIRFNSKVLKMEWDESISRWRVLVLDKETNKEQEYLYDIIINGAGPLRKPNYPKEFEAFTGTKIHTAEWDSSIDLENKVVGIVGSGASAVQVITEIVPKVKELHCYQRKPAWISPRSQYDFSDTVKLIFRIVPLILWLYRSLIFLFADLRHNLFIYDSWLNKRATRGLKQTIRDELPEGDPKALQLTPSYTLGCKRIVKSSDYYPALGRSHVKIIRDEITNMSGNEIKTEDGKSQKLDVLILATGFKVQDFFAPIKIIGRNGVDLLASWKNDGPMTYNGITCSIAPNHFFLLGPNTGLGHNSVLFMIECQVTFILNVIQEMMKREAKQVTVKSTAEEEFISGLEDKLKSTVWAKGNCDSWYSNSRGEVTLVWPWTCSRYWVKTRKVDHSKFVYV